MVFSSIVFLSIFLPAVFLIYTVIPSLKVRNVLLIAASLVFYAYGEPVYVLLMLFSSVLNYACARWVAADPRKKSKAALVTAVASKPSSTRPTRSLVMMPADRVSKQASSS